MLLSFLSCSKENFNKGSISSIQITNAVIDGQTMKINNFLRDSITTNSSKVISLESGLSKLYLYPTADSLHPYFNKTLPLEAGSNYSLYLSGNISSIDTIFTKEYFPKYVDSVYGIRFVNLCINSKTLKINLSTSESVSEFNNIKYKSITNFKSYSGLSVDKSYSFQIRDSSSNALLLSYTLAPQRFLNVTLVIKGLIGGTGANNLGIIRLNHY